MCPCGTLEDSPSGLWRTLGKRVGLTPSGVRIPYPPRWLAPRPFAGEQAILVGYENPWVWAPAAGGSSSNHPAFSIAIILADDGPQPVNRTFTRSR